ncbi:expressed protein [Chlorella variabilis]|uniref:Expressed protein n=1 Tax=Chlorella variabilis TaxID=554065 RepID=E1ZAJ3_CHLVA|nr:expressed protein [Chlorella variabilis]EFN57073.1 expressed protein [Chlorella variabilis]|eukprot:XP_005849175.1 expressed protein [Chlorella variabilis]
MSRPSSGTAATAPREPIKMEPTILGIYTHKGGTGKTTHAIMMGAMLAQEGYGVILVDADPQMSLTTQYAEDALEETLPSSDSEGEGEASDTEEEGWAVAAGGYSGGQLVLPAIPGDRLRKTDPLTPDVFEGIKQWCEGKDNLFDALVSTVLDKSFVATPTKVNTGDYKGRLMLLPEVLPRWLSWFNEFAPSHTSPPSYAYPRHFPRILPFLGFNYELRGSRVLWSASNLFETLRQIINGQGGADIELVPKEIKALYVPCQKHVRSPETEMLIPFVKHLNCLPVAQECGRPLFDLDEKNLQDYYHNSMAELDIGKLESEKLYVSQRFRAMARGLIVLHKHLQQQKAEAAAAAEAKRGHKKRKQGASAAGGDAHGAARRKQSNVERVHTS